MLRITEKGMKAFLVKLECINGGEDLFLECTCRSIVACECKSWENIQKFYLVLLALVEFKFIELQRSFLQIKYFLDYKWIFFLGMKLKGFVVLLFESERVLWMFVNK